MAWGATAAIVLIAIAGFPHGWWSEIRTALERTNVYLFLTLLCVLPLGGMSIAALTTGRVVILVGILSLPIGICAWIVWHLRRKEKAQRSPAASVSPRARAA